MTIPTKLDAHNMLTCKLAVSQSVWSTNNSETSFTFKVDTPERVTTKVLPSTLLAAANANAVATTEATDAAKAEKQRHITFIKGILDDMPEVQGRDAKAAVAKILFDYLSGEALEFVKNHEKFRKVVIEKCYELKTEAPERTKMVESCNRVLMGLGEPLIKPVTCLGGHNTPCVSAPKPATAPAPTTAAPTPPPAPTVDPDLALFLAVARKLKCTSVLQNSTEYLGYWRRAVKRGYYTGKSKADSMEAYMSGWWGYYNDEAQRERLMKSLFDKNKLPYDPVVMDMYYEWVKTYTPPARPRNNRYLKMVAFIDANRAAFTTL
jgi:hypothetical protein